MLAVHLYCGLIWCICWVLQDVTAEYVNLSHDGPVMLGGTITFRADLYTDRNERPSGTYKYMWKDNALKVHEYKTDATSNTTTFWSISYPPDVYQIGSYEVEVTVSEHYYFIWKPITSRRVAFEVTRLINGNVSVSQLNETVESTYVSSLAETRLNISIRKGDYDYIKSKATSVITYWFIDCKNYGQTDDLSFVYNFTNPDVSHMVEALVVASYEPPTTTTVLPPTTTPTPVTTAASNTSTPSANSTTTISTTLAPVNATTVQPVTLTAATAVTNNDDTSAISSGNTSVPFICLNSSFVPPDPNKTYGYFQRQINVRAPITNISVEGTNWIQPWAMLSLNVTCKGSGPFSKCLQFHRGKYNVTGNETCNNMDHLNTCNFSIIHYFLEPTVYTILVILNNDVSTQIYPLTINIYKATTKPQLSVIVVPVSCTLLAVVLIVFGVAYYIQSRARFTVEVADFDFGQNNPEMEYKTFTERLRDSFNNAGYKPLNNQQAHQ